MIIRVGDDGVIVRVHQARQTMALGVREMRGVTARVGDDGQLSQVVVGKGHAAGERVAHRRQAGLTVVAKV